MRRLLNAIELVGLGLFFGLLWLFYRATRLPLVRGVIWLWREVRWQAWRAWGRVLKRLPQKTREF